MGKMECERYEREGWLKLAEKGLKEFWDNELDNKIWSKYLE